MEYIERKILHFGTLSIKEQQELEDYVAAHPEWQSLLAEVKALEAIRGEVAHLLKGNEEALAYYAIAKRTALGASSSLQQVFEQVEDRLATDPDLQARYETMSQRLDEVAAALDPAAQFEALSGFQLSPSNDVVADEDAEAAVPLPTSPRSFRASIQAVMARIRVLPRAIRWAAATAVLVAVLYIGLYGISRALQSDIDRLALVDLSETEIQGYQLTTRGTPRGEGASSNDTRYLQALQTLRDARTSTLGLFPRYDQEQLAQAEQLLQQVVESEEEGSFLQVEASFFLGKVCLAQGNVEAARTHFRDVAARQGRRAEEAVDILTVLQEQYPAHAPD